MRRALLVGAASLLAVGAVAVAGAATSLTISSRHVDAFSAAQTATTVPSDTTPPQLQTLEMFDTNTNGRVDRVVATFSEPLQASTSTAGWSLANVPSNGTLSAVTVLGNGTTATLAITEGAGAHNTAVGSFTVALDQATSDIKDATGNKASFAATGPVDKAAPVLTGVTDQDTATGNGKLEQGDWADFTFSEPMNLTALGISAADVLVYDPQGDGNTDYLRIAGLLQGDIAIGTAYLSGQDTNATFPNASITAGASSSIVRVTLLNPCSGSCASLGSSNSTSVTWAFVPSLKGDDGLSAIGQALAIALF